MFEEGCFYHVYNRANGDENLFREEKNYDYFLSRYYEFINPVAETYAYCLMGNHFHLMLRVRSEEEAKIFFNNRTFPKAETSGKLVSRQFACLFSAYTQAYNKVYGRKGSLFQPNMKKKKVISSIYFAQLILYIHNNPVKHGFVKDLYDWPHSSIHQLAGIHSSKNSKLLEGSKTSVIEWFGGNEGFKKSHTHIRTTRSLFD